MNKYKNTVKASIVIFTGYIENRTNRNTQLGQQFKKKCTYITFKNRLLYKLNINAF